MPPFQQRHPLLCSFACRLASILTLTMDDDMFGCFAAAPAQPSAPAPKRPKPDVVAPPASAAVALPSSSPPNDSKPSAAPLSHIDGSACLAADSITTRLTQLCGRVSYAPLTAIILRLTPRPSAPPHPASRLLEVENCIHEVALPPGFPRTDLKTGPGAYDPQLKSPAILLQPLLCSDNAAASDTAGVTGQLLASTLSPPQSPKAQHGT